MATGRFFVENLELENFRCFEKVKLGPFDPHFNLLVGTNGVGKSSVLLALANLFRQLSFPNSDGLDGKIIGSRDVRVEHRIGADGVRFQAFHPPGSVAATFKAYNIDCTAFETISPLRKSADRAPVAIWRSVDGREIWRLGQDESGNLHPGPLSVIAFFTTLRLFQSVEIEEKEALDLSGNRGSAFVNWCSAGTNARGLREWIKDQTLAALQQDFRERDTDPHSAVPRPLRQLRLIQEAIANSVEGSRTIEFDADRKDIVVEFEDGSRKDFASMSDGQRALIGLVADIARRACLLNAPYLGARTLLETPGLVLIDELDLHLHPRWQRRIVGDLKRIFPKIQFFATTHSPQIIGEARPEEIVMLTPTGQKRPTASYGMTSDWVLECLMEAEGRDPGVALEIKSLFDEIEDGKFDEARTRIERLRREIGEMPDLVGAESYIWRVEHEDEEAAE